MWCITGISQRSDSTDSEKMNYLFNFIYFSIGQTYSSLKIFLPSLNLINQIWYVYSLTKNNELCFFEFPAFFNLSNHQEIKELFVSLFSLWLFYCCTNFPIPSNKSIDLLTSWQWSSSNSALALNTNKKFSISSPKRRFNQISPFP